VLGDREGRYIARQWDREIEDESRRLAGARDEGPWRNVVWGVLWLLWIGFLALAFVLIRPLHW
jgi:hypothetical protein